MKNTTLQSTLCRVHRDVDAKGLNLVLDKLYTKFGHMSQYTITTIILFSHLMPILFGEKRRIKGRYFPSL